MTYGMRGVVELPIQHKASSIIRSYFAKIIDVNTVGD